ncbi:general APC amino acid permease [Mycena alexandri]|uniref:General APC amino acid permease n=1 Tax=Mycena alexandri TaxID=1745969 RepID=A0AAD6SNY8_9AGAR|nr:general APC amino acid permease [Mycena alexandri]
MDKEWRASKSSQEIVETVASDDRYDFDFHDLDRVQRRLKQRHVQMIAIAGTVGTGLFLGSGNALQVAGPLGALIAYGLVGTVAYSSLCCIGEMTTWAPISGTFPHLAARWVDPAFGFAIGWNYFYHNAIIVPVEISAAVILMTFWDKETSHAAIYTAIITILVCSINIFGVRYFGETEFVFSIIKLALIIIILLAGLIIDLGGGPNHERIGFKGFWINPGAVNRAHLVENVGADRFLGDLQRYYPSRILVPGHGTGFFYRIVIFYMLGILMVGMLVSYDNPELLSKGGTAAQSPFVIAMKSAGHEGALVFSRSFSPPVNSLFLASSPITIVNGPVFNWFVNVVTTGSFIGWFSSSLTDVFFHRGMTAQGYDLKKNIYNNPLQ